MDTEEWWDRSQRTSRNCCMNEEQLFGVGGWKLRGGFRRHHTGWKKKKREQEMYFMAKWAGGLFPSESRSKYTHNTELGWWEHPSTLMRLSLSSGGMRQPKNLIPAEEKVTSYWKNLDFLIFFRFPPQVIFYESFRSVIIFFFHICKICTKAEVRNFVKSLKIDSLM